MIAMTTMTPQLTEYNFGPSVLDLSISELASRWSDGRGRQRRQRRQRRHLRLARICIKGGTSSSRGSSACTPPARRG